MMLNEGNKMYHGYLKVIGKMWVQYGVIGKANMDLLDKNSGLNLYDKDWRIYTRTKHLPPQYIGKNSVVRDSLINEGCTIEGEVNNSVVFSGATVEEGAVVNGSIIFSNAVIKKGTVLNKAIVLENTIVQPNKRICKEYEDDICLIEQGSVSIEQEEALYA